MQTEPHIQPHVDTAAMAAQHPIAKTFFGPSIDDVDIDGLDLETAAQTLGIAVDDLWRRIRNGQIMARSERGKVYVYTQNSAKAQAKAATVEKEDLPPPPGPEVETPSQVILTQMQESLVNEAVGTSLTVANREIALLIDHLSLAKDENREIIRFTRESMSRLTEMTDTMLQMKDEVIAAREQQVEMLHERIKTQTEELRAALREKENLETLTRNLGHDL